MTRRSDDWPVDWSPPTAVELALDEEEFGAGGGGRRRKASRLDPMRFSAWGGVVLFSVAFWAGTVWAIGRAIDALPG